MDGQSILAVAAVLELETVGRVATEDGAVSGEVGSLGRLALDVGRLDGERGRLNISVVTDGGVLDLDGLGRGDGANGEKSGNSEETHFDGWLSEWWRGVCVCCS